MPAVPLDPESVLLTDQVAVVTGAAVGIGRATALALARFGADVAICDRDADALATLADEVTTLGRRCHPAVLDVRDADAVGEFLDAIGASFGRIDVLVNNAGGGFHARFTEVSAKGERSLIDENFTSVTRFVRGAVPHMPTGRGGSIITITSIEAHRAGPGYAVYSAMKAAVANLTKTLALELGPQMIRVNCIAPDVIPTPGIGDELGDRTPLARAGHVDDVAAAAVFLANPNLSGFMTGTTLHVDGGNLAAGGWRRNPDDNDGSYVT